MSSLSKREIVGIAFIVLVAIIGVQHLFGEKKLDRPFIYPSGIQHEIENTFRNIFGGSLYQTSSGNLPKIFTYPISEEKELYDMVIDIREFLPKEAKIVNLMDKNES